MVAGSHVPQRVIFNLKAESISSNSSIVMKDATCETCSTSPLSHPASLLSPIPPPSSPAITHALNCSARLQPYLNNLKLKHKPPSKKNHTRLFTTAAASSSPTANGEYTKPVSSLRSKGAVKTMSSSLSRLDHKRGKGETLREFSKEQHLREATANSAVSSSCIARINKTLTVFGGQMRGDLGHAVAPADASRGAEYDEAGGWKGGSGVEDAGVGEGVYV
jgi:hypothetical protein